MQTRLLSLIRHNRYTIILVSLFAMLFLTGFQSQSSTDCMGGPKDCTLGGVPVDSLFKGCCDTADQGTITPVVTAVGDSTPLDGATVGIDTAPPQSLLTSITEGTDGPRKFSYLPPQTYTLNATKTGYVPNSLTVKLTGTESLTPRIQLTPVAGSITGKVTDAKTPPTPIAGATVSLSAPGVPARTSPPTTATGVYTFDNVPALASLTLRATADKYDAKVLTLSVLPGENKTGQDFALTQTAAAGPTGSVTVTVLDATTGAKVPLASITSATFGGVPLLLRTSDSTFNLPAAAAGSNIPLAVSATGFTPATRNVTLAAGQTQSITIPLSPVFPTTSAAPTCESAGKSYRITLDWQRDAQNHPTDLDLLLVVPRTNQTVGCYLDNDYPGNLCSAPNAQLRVENVHTAGSPVMESVDISLLNPGTYMVVVNDYSGEIEHKDPPTTLGDPKTAATVTVYGPKGTVSATAPVGPASGYWYWIPFTINGATGEVTAANPSVVPNVMGFLPNECP